MVYYSIQQNKLIGFEKSNRKNKMYNAILKNIKTGKQIKVPFGDKTYMNFSDKTGLNAYPHLIHGDKKRRTNYRKRHKVYLKKGYYSPSFFSYHFLWG